MHINDHRKAVVRALIDGCRYQPKNDSNSLAFNKYDDPCFEKEYQEHDKGYYSVCRATGLAFVDSLVANNTTCSNVGDLWHGLWLDEPMYLHDNDNEVSSIKGGDFHGNTLFPCWLAEVLNEYDLGIEEEDIYWCI
jgi:hypothetical protein